MRRSGRSTAGQSPARLGQGDGWSQGSAQWVDTPASPARPGVKRSAAVRSSHEDGTDARPPSSRSNEDEGAAPKADKARGIWIVYGLVVLYALCYQLQKPIEPFLVDKLIKNSDNSTDAATAYAKLKGYFSAFQGVGSLAFGYILDRWGTRTGLIINYLACACSYYILSIATSVELLYLSTVPGIAMAGFLCAQTAMIKLTEPGADRVAALGGLTAAYTIGGFVGPYIGGQLGATGDYYFGAQCAAMGSLIAVGLVLVLPTSIDKATTTVEAAEDAADDAADADDATKAKGGKNEKDGIYDSAQQGSWISRVASILGVVWIYLFVKVVSGVANSAAATAQPLVLKQLGTNEADMGSIMSAQFAFGGFANAVLLEPMVAYMGGDVSTVVQNCFISMMVLYTVQAAAYSDYSADLFGSHGGQSHYVFIGLAMPLAVFRYCLGTSITAVTSTVVDKKMQGTLMGMEHALFSLAYILGPQLGVSALESGIAGLSLTCAGVYGLVLAVWTVARR